MTHRLGRLLAACVGCLLFTCVGCQPVALPSPAPESAEGLFEEMEYRSEARLGVGWSALTNDIATRRATCIEKAETSSKTNDDPRYFGQFRLVHSTTDIEDGFGLSTSAAFQGLIYKVGGSVKYAQSKTFSADSINASGFITVETRSESLYGPDATLPAAGVAFEPSWASATAHHLSTRMGGLRLKPEYARMLKNDQKAFFDACGDGFVVDIYRGGRLDVLLGIATASVAENRKLAAEIHGSGGGVSIDVDAMISKVEAHKNTSVNGTYLAVGGDGRELGVASLDELKAMLKAFPAEVRKADAGIRIRVLSYAALVGGDEHYRFGVVDSARTAARLYLDLESVWATMRAMTDGPLNPRMAWTRSIEPQCLRRKEDEILEIKQALRARLEECGRELPASMTTPRACEASRLSIAPGGVPTADCPATTALIPPAVTDYDYRVFLPAFQEAGVLDACHQPNDAAVRERVRQDWLKPVIDARCGDGAEGKPECRSAVADHLVAAIPVVGPPPPPLPTGGYQRSCRNCVVKWDGPNRQIIQCSCARDGKYANTAWTLMQCPQRDPLQNCNRKLKYGRTC
ncbi:MAG: hypothetical protein ACFCUO_12730 [Rhodospirillales bacterium]